VRKTDLEGKLWITNFIFTNCPDVCPVMTAEMAQLQAELTDVLELRLVSITVDPEHDTPPVLSQYAQRFNADPARWLFLTGDKRAIYRLAKDGFRLGIVDPTEQPQTSSAKGQRLDPFTRSVGNQPQDFQSWWQHLTPALAFADHGRVGTPLHSARFVLVDRHARIRGYYASGEEASFQRLLQHLRLLRQEA
jgi:cytochrome oxidase Cu insertion factor (SCO1/SenC/PrrC family)